MPHGVCSDGVCVLDITAVCAFAVVEVAFASAVITGDFEDVMSEFHVGNVVTALTVTLMVCGFGIGPLFWSPLVSLNSPFDLFSWCSLVYRVNCSVADCSGSYRRSSTCCSSSGVL